MIDCFFLCQIIKEGIQGTGEELQWVCVYLIEGKKNWTKSTSFKVVVDSVEGEVGMGERADAAQREDQENQTNLKEGKGKPESSHSTR